MKCKNCGKRIKKNELFCSSCGYYNGDATAVSWDEEADLLEEEKEKEQRVEEQIEKVEEKEEIYIPEKEKKRKKLKKEKEEEEFVYENEDLLEDFIGEDYKTIKTKPFNIWACLLSWVYFVYRKLFIIGGIGLLLTALIIIFLRKLLIVYMILVMIGCGFAFNPIYIIIAKKKI